MSEKRELVVVALVAVVALVGVLSHQSTGAATMPIGLEADEAQGWLLGSEAYLTARESSRAQNRACSYACQELCPAQKGWTPNRYRKLPDSECTDFCKMRCERLLVQDYQATY